MPLSDEVEGLPARILATVIAAKTLSASTVRMELDALQAALVKGEIATNDEAYWLGEKLVASPNATWTALEGIVEERFPEHASRGTFAHGARQLRAFAALIAHDPSRLGPKRWTPIAVDAGGLLFARTNLEPRAGRPKVEICAADVGTLEQSLKTALPRGSRWSLRLLSAGSEEVHSSLASASLEGVEFAAYVTARDLQHQVSRAQRRVRILRAAGVTVALAISLAALAVLRALKATANLLSLRSTFVASVSHDLRTPVASVALMAENLRTGHARGREAEYAAAIEREAARLARLVDDLLDFGRIERGLPAKLIREDVLLRPWLEEFGAAEAAKCAARDRRFSVTLEDLPLSAKLDRLALERAVSNLIDNALHHARLSSIELCVRGVADREALAFEVLDESGNVTSSRLENLFEPFARGADNERAGTGLGLAIVRAVAEAHGGSANLARRADGPTGLVARIEIPTKAEETDAA